MTRSKANHVAIEAGLADVNGELDALRAEAATAHDEYIEELADAAWEDYLYGMDYTYDDNPYDD